jgi:hypothetical protein
VLREKFLIPLGLAVYAAEQGLRVTEPAAQRTR